MKAVELKDAFGLDHLSVVERTEPTPKPNEVRIRMRSVSLNYRDLLMVRGLYNPRQPLPLIPCSDGSGVIDAIGDEVTGFSIGDRVMGCFAQQWIDGPLSPNAQASTLGGPLDGMLCELRCLPEHGVVRVPDYLTDTEASTLPCAALTAWSALVKHGGVSPDETVVVLGTGGVSLFALQFAKSLGANVVVTSSSDAKLAQVTELGADYTVNYKEHPEWHKEVLRLAGPADHVIEVGGAGTFDRSAKCLRPNGSLHLIGVLSGANPPVNLTRVLMNNLRVQGTFVGHRAGLIQMLQHMTAHSIRPVICRTHELDDSAQAFQTFAAASHVGKSCITVPA